MGLSEEQLLKQMEQWHPYAFNMGHGKTIPFKDYQEAAQVLMERNMTEVLNDSQTKATVLPETHVPKMPRIVDAEEYEEKKKNLADEELDFLEMKKGREGITNAAGDLVEKSSPMR